MRFHAVSSADFTVTYRGYDIEVTRASTGWRVGVYPRTASNYRFFRRDEVYAGDPDRAVVEAKTVLTACFASKTVPVWQVWRTAPIPWNRIAPRLGTTRSPQFRPLIPETDISR